MKIYIVRDNKTHKPIGSRNKKVFTALGHIKTSYAFDAIKRNTAYIQMYDLSSLEPTIIPRTQLWPFITWAEAKLEEKLRGL